MFVDLPHYWSPPEGPQPEKTRPRLTKRQEKALGWILGFNILMLFLGPLAGSSVLEAIRAAMP
jgi:hypothetical protein